MNVGGIAVLGMAREAQVLLLAVLLLGGCAAKVRQVIRARSIARETGPTALFPVRLRRPVAIVVCVSEFGLGVGLLVTAGTFGAGAPALAVRWLTVVLFGTAIGALHVLRTRRPAAGCGCFGDLSDTPVNWRTLTRTALLCGAAVAALSAPPLHKPAPAQQAIVVLGVLVVEVSVLVALSPEFAEIMVGLGHNEPCEVRRLPVARSLTALRASSQWRQYHRNLITKEPADIWREGCWRFAVFPGMLAGRRVEVVFAVYLKPRRPQVRVGVFDSSAASRTLPAIPRQRQGELLPNPAPEDSVVL
jgi:Methylamine utilisation protein MauE